MYDLEKFQAAIEARMKQQDLSARKLALKSGLKEAIVGAILRGDTKDPRISTVAAIAEGLGCKIDDLLGKNSLRLISDNRAPVDTELLQIAIDSVNEEATKQGVDIKGDEWTRCVAEIYGRLESAANTESDTIKKAIKLVLAKK